MKFIVIIASSVVLLLAIFLLFLKLGWELPLGQRLVASAHALVFALLVPYALVLDAFLAGYPSMFFEILLWLIVSAGLASIVYSVSILRVRRRVHLIHFITLVMAVPPALLAVVVTTGWS